MSRVLGARRWDRDHHERADEKAKCIRGVQPHFRALKPSWPPPVALALPSHVAHALHTLTQNHGRCLASGSGHAMGLDSPVDRTVLKLVGTSLSAFASLCDSRALMPISRVSHAVSVRHRRSTARACFRAHRRSRAPSASSRRVLQYLSPDCNAQTPRVAAGARQQRLGSRLGCGVSCAGTAMVTVWDL